MLAVTLVDFVKIIDIPSGLYLFNNELIKYLTKDKKERYVCEYVKSDCIFGIYIYELP